VVASTRMVMSSLTTERTSSSPLLVIESPFLISKSTPSLIFHYFSPPTSNVSSTPDCQTRSDISKIALNSKKGILMAVDLGNSPYNNILSNFSLSWLRCHYQYPHSYHHQSFQPQVFRNLSILLYSFREEVQDIQFSPDGK